MSLETLIQIILNGIAIGILYSLVALGISLLWNASGIFNFAQADFLVLGAYIMLTLYSLWHIDYIWATILTLIVMGVLGYLLSMSYFNLLFKKKIDSHLILISTIAMSIFVQNSILLIWGPHAKGYKNIFGESPISLGTIRIMPHVLWIFGIVSILLTLLQLFMHKTKIGIGMRAIAQNPKAASLMGIKVDHMVGITITVSFILVTVAGILISPILPLDPFMGGSVIILAFCSLLIGGLGSFVGPLIGGLIVGTSSTLFGTFFSSNYKLVFVFGLMIIILLIKPGGIFRAEISEKV